MYHRYERVRRGNCLCYTLMYGKRLKYPRAGLVLLELVKCGSCLCYMLVFGNWFERPLAASLI